MSLFLPLRLPLLAILLVACLLVPGYTHADVLTTKHGLVLEGAVEKDPATGYRVKTAEGIVSVKRNDVLSVETGAAPRAAWVKSFHDATAKTSVFPTKQAQASAIYKLAVRADADGLKDLARKAHEYVIGLDANHRASRRALGHELHDGRWLSCADARRAQGLVLFQGAWRTPADIERVMAARGKAKGVVASPQPKTHVQSARWLETSVLGEPALRAVAARALQTAEPELVQAAGVRGLGHKDERVRRAAAKVLGELGDEASLRPLILSAARDKSEDVRREATLAAMAFGHDDLSIPFVRALGASNPKIVANAAQALGMIGDMRAVGYVVKRMTSAGSSTRNFLSVMNQISYVRDYDVEIAQASNIANPDVGIVQEGVILDAKVAGLYYTRTWIEPILVDAAGALAGERFRNREDVKAWYAKNKASIPEYPPKPGKRMRKKRRGRWIGVPQPTR